MSSIDERVVDMQFRNSDFNSKVQSTMGSLQKLKENLKLDGAARGLEEATRGVGNFGGVVSTISGQFSALQAVAFGAFASIGSRAIQAGQQMATALTISPVTSGLHEYEMNLNSIQTILANTKASGATLEDVNASLAELNAYSDETIYNFGQMANAIGMFTASGVDLETSTAAIKGIANLAALSGSSAEQAAGLYRQLSQAISSGKVSLMDWQSVVTANMGGTVFQRALAQTAVAMGTIDEGALKLEGSMQNVKINGESFRDSISAEGGGESWLTSDVLVNTLRTFTGDMKAGELAAIGFKQAQIDSIIAQAKTAKSAAQDVKTLGQAFDIAKETAGSGWSYTWQIIMGDFAEAKSTFTAFSNWINGFIKTNDDARNELLKGWKKQGGRDTLLEGLRSAGDALLGVLRPIKAAFRTIFPATTVAGLVKATEAFANFTKSLIPSQKTAENLRRTFAGLFAVIGIVWELVKAGVSFLLDLFGVVTEGGGSILEFTGNIGDFLVALHGAIKNGNIFAKFFDRIKGYIEPAIGAIKRFIGAIFGIFDGRDDTGRTADAMERLGAITENLGHIGDEAQAAWQRFMRFMGRVADRLRPFFEGVGNFFGTIGGAIGDFLSNLTFGDIMTGVGVGAGAALVASIRKFLKNFDISKLFGGGKDEDKPGLFSTITDAIKQLTDTLKGMQNALNAGALLAIAAAIGILTLSIMALSRIPAGDLFKAIGAIATMVSELAAAAWVFSKFKTSDTVKIFVLGIGLSLLAVAIRLLASSVKALADIDWIELGRGVAGTILLLVALATATRIMSGGKTRLMVRTGIALAIISAAILILVQAVKQIQELNWESLAQGFAGVAALLTALALYDKFAKTNNAGIRSGVGLLLLATSILILAEAVKRIQKLDWVPLARGMSGFVVGLAAMAGAMRLMPKGGLFKGVTLILMATSLLIVGEALEKIAQLSWENFGKTMAAVVITMAAMTLALKYIPTGAIFSSAAVLGIAIALLIIGEALEKLGAMSWADIGAALVQLAVVMGIIGLFMTFAATGVGSIAMIALAGSLIVIAGAIYILSLAMERLGAMSWADIGAAIGGLALLFVVLAVGGALSPLILLLGIALGLLAIGLLAIGGAIYLAGKGIESFASAMQTLSEIDANELDNVTASISALLALIPTLAEQAALGVVAFVETLGANAGKMSDAVGAIIVAMAERIATDTPTIVDAFGTMMVDTLTSLSESVPDMVQAGADLIVGILDGMADNMDDVVSSGTDVVVSFLGAMGENAPKIANAGFMMILEVITALTIAISSYGPLLQNAASSLGDAIIDGITGGLMGGSDKVDAAAESIATGALGTANRTLGVKSPSREFMKTGKAIIDGLVIGLNGGRKEVQDTVNNLLGNLGDQMYSTQQRVFQLSDRLAQLRAEEEQDAKAIAETNAELVQASEELYRLDTARTKLATTYRRERIRLAELATSYEKVTNKLEAANDKLNDIRQTRDDYYASVRDQYNDLPEITGQTNLQKYMYDFQKQITDTQAFATGLQKLRKMGLNDTMYKELLAKGPEAMPFIQQLLAEGTTGVKKFNELGKTLDKAAHDLAVTASRSLYQAGVDAAYGLVVGLRKQQANLDKEMTRLANILVNAVKKALGIRSPSKVMAEIGSQTAEGMAQGLLGATSLVSRSAEQLGGSAIDGMRKTLSNLGDLISGELDANPVIAPVLDLNAVRKDASLLGSMLAVDPIDIQDQVARATDAAEGLRSNQIAIEELASVGSGDTVNFVQNNYSPKALSSADIYRQTNNQLSRAKGALAT